MSRTSSSPTHEATTAHGSSSTDLAENDGNQESATNTEAGVADGTRNLSRSSSMIREIYKNSWLKQIPCSDKWSGRIYKAQKPEKYWVVFCVHDEKDAFLEFYENRRSAYSHSPLSSVALSQCLHISPTIVVQDNDHEFVITLETQVIRLAASTREQMVEWMDTLRNKLRDLNILEPKDNLYSKEPIVGPKLQSHLSESSSSLESHGREESNMSSQSDNSLSRLSLRDPTSPLPPVPPGTSQPREAGATSVAYTRTPTVHQSTSSSSQSHPAMNQVDESVQTNDSIFSQAVPIARRESVTSQDRTSQANNSPRRISCSVPNTPATSAPDSGIYEPLFHMTTTEPSPNLLAMGIRNPSYENPPDTQRHSNPEAAPVLPPKLNSESRRLSLSAMNVRPSRPVNVGRSSSQVSVNLSNGVAEPSQSPVQSRSSRGESSASSTHFIDSRVPIVRNSSQSDDEPIMSSSYIPHSRSTPSSDPVPQTDENGRILSLREGQVLKLQSEIAHKSGVRLVLRKKDSLNAIAFVDCFGSVWVAGWKQKEHPLLHNAFHIGDRIYSVAGHKVHNTQEVLKLIKLQHIIIDFVVCRTPCAKVLALKKEYEGQDLGLVREGGTAEIKEVKAGGLALRHGLPPKASTMDNNGTCNWFLTEINHRPLNLFFKDNEVQDRLNAVGLDISILVQPIELVKALKKQLKTVRGYKDYTLA